MGSAYQIKDQEQDARTQPERCHDQPDFARRPRRVVGGMALGEAVMSGKIGLVGGEDEAVRGSFAAQQQRGK